jgi:Tfp pilus assembly protein PilX
MFKRLRQEERGIALVMTLGLMVALAIAVTAVIEYTSSNSRSTSSDQARQMADQYAEAGLNNAYTILNGNNTTGANPADAGLFGCTASGGVSNCSSPSKLNFCIVGSSPCVGQAGSASVYGYYSGTNGATYTGPGAPQAGIAVPAQTWLFFSTGYARNPTAPGTTTKTLKAMVSLSSANAGRVASVWNHIFITAPLVANQCQLDFSGNGILVDVPVYVIGNFCLSGQNASVQEVTGGQGIDMQVGGKLVLSGSGSKVGADSTHPITSGVVVGGCTTTSVSSTTQPCSPSSFNYWVGATDTFVPNDAPTLSATDMANNYANFDPGPKHPCQSGTTPAPLAASVFDNDTASNLSNEPNNSTSVFELTPNFSYSCISQNGAGTGQLSWDNSTKRLTIGGSIFIDGSMTVSQSATYTGTAVIEVAGTFTINGNGTALCATGPPCNFTNWQGTSSNTSMLTVAPLAGSTTAITFTNNAQTFQGSLWTQPTSSMTFQKNGVTVNGPISVGKLDSTFNNASIKPLPTITNMPIGAPIPPNTGLTVSPLKYID